jgi:hypothetical protein
MAYYSYNNTKVTINGDTVFANKADISMNTDLSPNFLVGDRSSFSNIAAGGSQGSMSISYYLTGSDPLNNWGFRWAKFCLWVFNVTLFQRSAVLPSPRRCKDRFLWKFKRQI